MPSPNEITGHLMNEGCSVLGLEAAELIKFKGI